MFNFKNLFFTLLLSTVFINFIAAQPPPAASKSSNAPTNTQSKVNFVSLDGGFAIDLPQQISSFTGIKTTAGVNKGGSQFAWNITQGFFMVAYVDRIFPPENFKQVLQSSADTVIQNIINKNGTLISKNEMSFNGNSGIEVRVHLKDGSNGSLRYILVKDRMYILTTSWKEGEDGAIQLKILDSFKLVDAKAIIAQKIKDATPQSLRQFPVVKKLKSDAEDGGLKGKVKLVTETEEDLAGNSVIGGIKMSSEDFYDESGNQIKHIYYDYRGNPSDVTVYGFIDGLRVSKSGNINYEYNPPPPAMLPPSSAVSNLSLEKPKTVDARYNTKYEYSYDDKGRLKEDSAYRNNGELTGKTVYSYDGNKLEKSSFDKGGKLTFKTIKIFDDKGKVSEETSVHVGSKYPDSKYTYVYDSFDERGNWTKRTVSGKEGLYNGGYKDINHIECRTITYYP